MRIERSCPQRSEGTAASANNSNNWWERSPNSSNANNFANVNGNNGNANNNNNANNLLAVRPDSPVDTISHITPRVAVRQGHPAATDGESASMGEGDMVVSGAARASRRHLKGVAHLAAAGVLDGGDVAAVRAAVRANCSSTSHSAGLGRKLLSESGLDGAARAGLEFGPPCRTLVELALER